MSKIHFIEDCESGYKHRTEVNAKEADLTVAFAIDFETSGEVMTKEFALKHEKAFYAFPLRSDNFDKNVQELSKIIKEKDCHSINVAGNGAYTLTKHGISQKECDDYIFNALSQVCLHSTIHTIRSGGQTGADESGIKAAKKLGIDAVSLCPKGWKIRTATETICDENFFKKRFD